MNIKGSDRLEVAAFFDFRAHIFYYTHANPFKKEARSEVFFANSDKGWPFLG